MLALALFTLFCTVLYAHITANKNLGYMPSTLLKQDLKQALPLLMKPTKCTNDVYFLNSLHLHVLVTFGHHQGVLLQSTVIQLYVHLFKIQLFTHMSSKTQSLCYMLTVEHNG
jgi:hypothetical protein